MGLDIPQCVMGLVHKNENLNLVTQKQHKMLNMMTCTSNASARETERELTFKSGHKFDREQGVGRKKEMENL